MDLACGSSIISMSGRFWHWYAFLSEKILLLFSGVLFQDFSDWDSEPSAPFPT